MKNKYVCKIAKKGKVGSMGTKYDYDKEGIQFEKNIQKGIERKNFLWNEFVAFMKAHNATPDEFRSLFRKYYDEYISEERNQIRKCIR